MRVELSDDVAEAVRSVANRTGRSEVEVVELLVRHFVAPSILDRLWGLPGNGSPSSAIDHRHDTPLIQPTHSSRHQHLKSRQGSLRAGLEAG
ncbi:MAG: hypothetical protein ACKVWR_10140 [Acidimicrobiales bacterium]